ncbi:hypothetical protein JCM24511_08845 [Saitozyma sp. JCM 24511]|nr:hypothetical protein JCM24511_08845 [Saitozyma sp. JCM 24511]
MSDLNQHADASSSGMTPAARWACRRVAKMKSAAGAGGGAPGTCTGAMARTGAGDGTLGQGLELKVDSKLELTLSLAAGTTGMTGTTEEYTTGTTGTTGEYTTAGAPMADTTTAPTGPTTGAAGTTEHEHHAGHDEHHAQHKESFLERAKEKLHIGSHGSHHHQGTTEGTNK